jgi:hypothetical protein
VVGKKGAREKSSEKHRPPANAHPDSKKKAGDTEQDGRDEIAPRLLEKHEFRKLFQVWNLIVIRFLVFFEKNPLNMRMVEPLPETSCFFADEIEGVQIIGRIRKLVVVTMMGCPPNHAFLGVRCREEGLNELHAPEMPFFLTWSPNEPLKPTWHLILKRAVREIAVPESRDEKHPPVTIQQADNQHGNAAKEPMPVSEAGQELVADPSETDNPKQIDDEKAALVEDILEVDPLPYSQFVFF